ncbi:MAG: FtsW/RodA/SpoVE family cell cycle protein, partial [Pseudomonadales bacterium]
MIRVDNALVVSWLSVLAIGTVMVASSSVAMSETYIARHAVFVVVSLFAFFFVLSVPLSVWEKYHRIAWLLAVLLCLLVLLPGVGREVNGATRTIGLGAFSLQASEVAKFLLLVYLAGYLARFSDDMRDKPIVLFIPLSM